MLSRPPQNVRKLRDELTADCRIWCLLGAPTSKAGPTAAPRSYKRLAQCKAETVNKLNPEADLSSEVEFAFGDGNQLTLIRYKRYCGTDVSPGAIAI
jgi:hypothetical protein